MRKSNIILFLLFILNAAIGQKVKFDQSDTAIEHRIKKDLYLLASDSLQGREAGTKFEIMARDYIIGKYKEMGLHPAFKDNSFIQPFTFKDTPEYGDSNYLKLNNVNVSLGKDFYPLAYSSSGRINGELVNAGYGINLPGKNYNDYASNNYFKGKIFLIETSVPKAYAADTFFIKYGLENRIDTAIAKGAIGIIFINSDTAASSPSASLGTRVSPANIPVIFVEQQAYKLIKGKSKSSALIKVNIIRKNLTAYNIAVFIDNKASTTVVIGAHYDHLGWGKESSMYVGTPKIHNGADDNGSGTVAVMELARYFMNSTKKNNNYLIMNFSAEEKGLIGSEYFTKSDEWNNFKINYMVNLDMVGRYDSSKVGLDIIGTGTSPLWDTLIATTPHKGLKIKKTKSGFDGSDQMSFYLKNVPVLFFFTGMHMDYHRPTDKADKINFLGEAHVIKYAENIIEKTDSLGKIPFAKTMDTSNKRPSFSVTLGVVPDHSFDGTGMRIEGVLDGKPAIKAGLQAGDIVIKIGTHDVSEIMSYMKALGSLKKGDKVPVTVKRGNETIVKEVQF
jgi:aminopeptidase YwaD